MANRAPLVLSVGRTAEMPSSDLLLGGALVKSSVGAGETVTVPAGYSLVVTGSYVVAATGNLVVNGNMRIEP